MPDLTIALAYNSRHSINSYVYAYIVFVVVSLLLMISCLVAICLTVFVCSRQLVVTGYYYYYC